ncbi:MAG: ATP-binding protein [Verrucomicrobiota bacterium]
MRAVSKYLPRTLGQLTAVIGCLIVAGWYAHWDRLLQWIPHTPPMQLNTALCFIVSGVALWCLTSPAARVSLWLGTIVLSVGLLTVIEYGTGWDLGIDRLLFTPYLPPGNGSPGRMSVLAAGSFILIGTTFIVAASFARWPHRWAIAAILICVVGMLAGVALIGFVFHIRSAYGWGSHSSLALNTVVAFLTLSIGLFIYVWQQAQQTQYDFARWLPVTGSVTIMAMVGFVAAGNLKLLKEATFWRKHTLQAILATQVLENELIDLQRGMRGYVTLGDTNALAAFRRSARLAGEQLEQLTRLVKDNESQVRKLAELTTTVRKLVSYDSELISLYDRQGPQVSYQSDLAGQGRALFGAVHETLRSFIDTERGLLDVRDAAEERSHQSTERLLLTGCALAAVLILIANYMATRELSHRRRAESKLARRADALRRSNAELEQFAYVASHDLREPLRAVSGFTQILKRKSEGQLDEQSIQLMDRIVQAAKRMGAVIDDLLALSRIGGDHLRFVSCELERPLKRALENLSVVISETGAEVQSGALPLLPIDASQITLLFQNLISNAIKFCRDRTPKVSIQATRGTEPGWWQISVRDNGIGIDQKHFAKIFVIFQRLHSREAYPGTGIGLAICRKIVEQHHGRIWLDSDLGVGTTFHFTLPERQPEKHDGE